MKIESAEFSRRLASRKEKSHYGAKLFEFRVSFSEGSVAIRFQERARARDGGGGDVGGPGLLRKKASGARGGARSGSFSSSALHMQCCVRSGRRGRRGGSGVVDGRVTLYQYNIDPTLSHTHTYTLTRRILSHALSSRRPAHIVSRSAFFHPRCGGLSLSHTRTAHHPPTDASSRFLGAVAWSPGSSRPATIFTTPLYRECAPADYLANTP